MITEQVIGIHGEGNVNELTLTPLAAGTPLALVITFSDADTRAAALATGMTDGMEPSYTRLENRDPGRADDRLRLKQDRSRTNVRRDCCDTHPVAACKPNVRFCREGAKRHLR